MDGKSSRNRSFFLHRLLVWFFPTLVVLTLFIFINSLGLAGVEFQDGFSSKRNPHDLFSIVGQYTGFYDFPDRFFSESSVPAEQVVMVTDAQYLTIKQMHNGIQPYRFARFKYDPTAFGHTLPNGVALGDAAFPGLNAGHHRWEVMAHEQGHNFFGGTSVFYGKLAFPHPFLQESLAVLTAFYSFSMVCRNVDSFRIQMPALESMRFDYSNGRNLQREKFEEYIANGKPFSVEDVLTSQALSYRMINLGEQFGWQHYEKLSRTFEDGISGRFDFQKNGVSAPEQSTYIIAALGVTFQKDFRTDFAELNFPIDYELYELIYPVIWDYIYDGGNGAEISTARLTMSQNITLSENPLLRLAGNTFDNSIYLPLEMKNNEWCNLY
jgi:hypothetical protein